MLYPSSFSNSTTSHCFVLLRDATSSKVQHLSPRPSEIKRWFWSCSLRLARKNYHTSMRRLKARLASGSPVLSIVEVEKNAQHLPDDRQLTVAYITLLAEDGLEVRTVECFECLTSSADCKCDHRMVSCTFLSQDTW